MSAPTLYHLGGEFLALEQLLDEAEDAGQDLTSPDVVAIIARWFSALEGQLVDKVGRCVAVVREQQAKADVVDGEVVRLQKLAASRRGRAARIKDAIHAAMTIAQTRKLDTALGVVSVCGNGGKQPVVVDPAVDPDVVAVTHPDLVEVRTILNTDAVRAALAAGVSLPFAQLAPRGEHVRIK